ncbi:MAG: hypothetical protein K2I03_05005 [Lachnospiraceae bacterium]|nr:hypothetical protein [Lachnospiraceae bacterium]
MKKLYCYTLCIFLMCTVIFQTNASYAFADENITDTDISNETWPSPPDVVAEAGIVMEASTGTVLYDKNMNDVMYPASITKILTTLITLENSSLDEIVNFYHYDVYSLVYGDAHIGMKENEQLNVLDCLYGVMLASANECANAAGEHVARKTTTFTDTINKYKASGEEYDESKTALKIFADIMNNRAKEAGAKNSHFNNPSGLFDEDHYTTCYDMAMITRDAIQNKKFLEIESNTTYRIPNTNLTAETRGVSNRHKMLYPENKFYYEGVLGGKTGYVDQSGNTLVTFAKRNGITLICVIMKSNYYNVYNDTRLLLDYGFNNFSMENISENETEFSKAKHILSLDSNDAIMLPNGLDFKNAHLNMTFFNGSKKTGNQIACLDYYYAGRHIGSTNLSLNVSDSASFKSGPTMAVHNQASEKQKSGNYIFIFIWTFVAILLIILIYKRRKHFNIKKS